MSERKSPKAWAAYKIAKIGKRLGTVYGGSSGERAEGVRKDRGRAQADLSARAVMQYGRPNLNEGKDWSEMDLFDLKDGAEQGTPVMEIAHFLCRSEHESCEEIAEFGLLLPDQRGHCGLSAKFNAL
jgi:hypothetical protein